MTDNPEDPGQDNPAIDRAMAEPLAAMIGRRAVLKGAAAAGLFAALPSPAVSARTNPSTLTFAQPPHRIAEDHAVATGYRADVLIGFGDSVSPGVAAADPASLDPAALLDQFGANCDFTAYLPLPHGSSGSRHGLLCVNHEYTNRELLWPATDRRKPFALSEQQMAAEMAAHGHSVIEVKQGAAGWRVIANSPYARRISAITPIRIAGPVAGHPRLRTQADPHGRIVLGTLNNCAGGKTPWGTVLIAEENIQGYFAGDPSMTPEALNHARMGINNRPRYGWARHHRRFDVEQEPNEANRFGWMVEIDPYDRARPPVKRTALGRFRHEGAGVALTADRRAAIYMGDDQAFEYLYRFVSSASADPGSRAANRDLLDQGVLYVARFFDDGTGEWRPLIWGEGPLTLANGFGGPADVMIEARRAADLLGATPLDRPEDTDVHPETGRVYVMLTNNRGRDAGEADAANPRGPNPHGHVIELTPTPGPDGRPDHGADKFTWEVLLQAGNPADTAHGARYHPGAGAHGAWFSSPDNGAVDPAGRLWIATDQGRRQFKNGIPDGLYGMDVSGPGRALPRLFYAGPAGSEICGPEFTPDGRTLFLAVQHPGEGSTFDNPSTRWPDFDPARPPRAAVVAITKKDGGVIGS